ncbi:NADH-quinone oxidoreductase subunit N [Streptomyces pactum]|uniref:NADH-quinone oxidoreductase subunit N n=1 Tax=Streptomyces pactum TaxID=68249 RepID=UPI0036F9AFAA
MTAGAANLVQSVDWVAVAPPTVAAVVAIAVLVADLFLPEDRKPVLGRLAVAGIVLAGLALLPLRHGDRDTFCLTTPSDGGLCSYVADDFTVAVQLLVVVGALLAALLSIDAVTDRRLPAGEFWFLLLSAVAGALLLPAARDLATLVVALEVASLPAFALVGLRRGDRASAEAALKFFLSSVTATAVTLLGVSFVYAATGSMHLTAVADGLAGVDPGLANLARAGVALTLIGFAFKTAAVPFHFWVPETYVGAPLPVAGYLSVVGKAVGFTGIILVTVLAFPGYDEVWGPVLAVLAALTMTVGNAGALRQRPDRPHSAVRLLAWSSVGQAGYLLVPVAAAGYADRGRDAAHAIGATVAYGLMYAAVNLGAFGVAALVARRSPANRIDDYRGLYATRPLAALCLGFFLLCLAGLPPGVIGLFAKVAVFSTAVDAGLGWLAVVMAVNVVIALVYYLRWTAVLFRGGAGPAEAPAAGAAEPAPAPVAAAATATAAGGAAAPGGAVAPVPGTESAGAASPAAGRAGERTPVALAAAIGLATLAGVALSVAPQLVLHFAAGSLF